MSRPSVSRRRVGTERPLSCYTQAPARVIEDGALDRIELFAATLDTPTSTVVAIVPSTRRPPTSARAARKASRRARRKPRRCRARGRACSSERFVAELKASGPFSDVVAVKAGDAPPAGALVMTGRFVTLDPGSRTKRYFAGFGAGKSSVKVAGEVKDASGQDARDVRAAPHRRDGHGRWRLARQADGRLAQHRRGPRQVHGALGSRATTSRMLSRAAAPFVTQAVAEQQDVVVGPVEACGRADDGPPRRTGAPIERHGADVGREDLEFDTSSPDPEASVERALEQEPPEALSARVDGARPMPSRP